MFSQSRDVRKAKGDSAENPQSQGEGAGAEGEGEGGKGEEEGGRCHKEEEGKGARKERQISTNSGTYEGKFTNERGKD